MNSRLTLPLTLCDGGPHHIETSLLICSENQWTSFSMIETSVAKELNIDILLRKSFILTEFTLSSLYYWSLKQSAIFLLLLYTVAGIGTPTSLLICVQLISQWEGTQIWWLWRRHEHQTEFREFIYEEILAYEFSNVLCTISLHNYNYS